MTALGMSSDQSFLHLTAKQILSLHADISDIYKLIDHYDEYGCFPQITVKDEIIRTPAEEIQLLRQSNSKAKKRLNSGTCKDIDKTKKLIEANNIKIRDLLNKISK
ncbi:hypothetical protein D3C86_1838410 [compost metagenome]